jgi:hypothetical protein
MAHRGGDMSRTEDMIPLVDAAIRLHISHQAAQRLLHTGILHGERRGVRGGRWFVTEASVREAERLIRQREPATKS